MPAKPGAGAPPDRAGGFAAERIGSVMHRRLAAPPLISPWPAFSRGHRRVGWGWAARAGGVALGLLLACAASAQVSSTEVSSTEVSSTEVSSTEVSSTEVSSTEVSSTEMSSTEVSSTEVSSTPGSPADVTSAQIAGTQAASAHAAAQAAFEACPELSPARARVASVSPAGDLVLADGTVLRLAGLAGGGAGAEVGWRPELARRVAGRDIAFAAGPVRDRYGRRAALARGEGEAGTLQQALLAEGLALARPEQAFLGCLPGWLEAEASARREKRGIWRALPLDARDIKALRAQQGRFTIVAGHILDVGKTNRVDYLNFGRVWRQDMTGRVETEGRSALEARGLDVARLAGRWVRLRGTVFEAGGPAITLRRAEQIDLAVDQAKDPPDRTRAGHGAAGRKRPTGDE